MQANAISLGRPPEIGGKITLLKTVHGHRTWRNQTGTGREASSRLGRLRGLLGEKGH